MNSNNIEQAIRFAELVKEGSAYTKTKAYMACVNASRTLSYIDTEYCNGTRYTGEGESEEACKKVYTKLNALLLPLGLYYYHQSDPRGASLYVSDKWIDNTRYSTEALAIY